MLQVAYLHCATCFGRCYPGGAALIMDAKNLYDGISRLIAASSARELPKPVNNGEAKSMVENGNLPAVENGEETLDADAKQTEVANAGDEENRDPASQTETDQTNTNFEQPT